MEENSVWVRVDSCCYINDTGKGQLSHGDRKTVKLLYMLYWQTKSVNMHSAKLLQHIMYTNPSKSLLKVITYIFRSVLSIIYGFYLMNRKVLLSYRDV
jgi:hypothetical protein